MKAHKKPIKINSEIAKKNTAHKIQCIFPKNTRSKPKADHNTEKINAYFR